MNSQPANFEAAMKPCKIQVFRLPTGLGFAKQSLTWNKPILDNSGGDLQIYLYSRSKKQKTFENNSIQFLSLSSGQNLYFEPGPVVALQGQISKHQIVDMFQMS